MQNNDRRCTPLSVLRYLQATHGPHRVGTRKNRVLFANLRCITLITSACCINNNDCRLS